MKKKILHITDALSIGGTEILLKNTLPLLPEYDHIVCYLHGQLDLIDAFAGVPVHCLNYNGKKDFVNAVFQLNKILKKNKVDIIHAHLLWSSLIARMAKTKSCKLICSLHSVMSEDAFKKNKFSLWAEKLTIRKVDALIGVSEFVVKDYLQYVPFKGATYVLYNFVPDQFFTNVIDGEISVNNTKLRCVTVGNIKPVKNYDYIITSFEKLKEEPISLAIFGMGTEMDKIEQYIGSNKLDVHLMGLHHIMENVLSGYDVFIQASRYEGYGIAMVEAMAKGLLPVISDIPVHREIAGEHALYFDLYDNNALRDQLQKIANDKSIIQKRRKGVIERARQVGSSVSYKNKLMEIYDAL
jgi:glycosyltransferase involved in cell wall biosynthesis